GGEYVGGAAVESVAYNPSLGPMHVALSQLALRAPQRKWSEVESALLVESNGPISYRASSEQILRTIAPGSCLETVPWLEG
ncbi:MAG: cytidine deaminase, partial [Planctomycetes bacterium]|nr:cytidine deaminase [Planctomycetota bacterium]